ncbi:heavy-metal-associated domain-containing protein [Pseudarthrobacter oxydans]|uniref:heavy-metal-associated domain-containing protein n=1 Tax=Pseudarthrobacter oxydans TaxID=1671 RepID=UPI00381655F4
MWNQRITDRTSPGLRCTARLQLLLPGRGHPARGRSRGPAGGAGPGAQCALEGLTCGHCVQTVEKAVSGVSGVHSASVDLVPGGTSRLNITGTCDPGALAEAVRSSGYALAGAN